MLELDVISKDEIVKVSRFLEQIFSHRKLIFWEKSVFSILKENSINGIDNAGYIYCKNSEIYAAILIIYSKDKQGFSLSSWGVHPEETGIAYPFLRAVLNKLKHKVIYNHSAVHGVRQLMEAVGFKSINKAAIPLPSLSISSLKELANISLKQLKENIIQIENTRCLKIRLKLCSLNKKGGFRNLAIMVGANKEPKENELREFSSFLALKFIILVCPKSPNLKRCWTTNSFETLSNIKVSNIEQWYNIYAQSEYEIMDF